MGNPLFQALAAGVLREVVRVILAILCLIAIVFLTVFLVLGSRTTVTCKPGFVYTQGFCVLGYDPNKEKP